MVLTPGELWEGGKKPSLPFLWLWDEKCTAGNQEEEAVIVKWLKEGKSVDGVLKCQLERDKNQVKEKPQPAVEWTVLTSPQ